MSQLRNNLDRAKAEYQAARYPGDLGLLVDSLPTQIQAPSRSIWSQSFATLAMAACALVGVGVVWTVMNSGTASELKTAVIPKMKNETVAVAPTITPTVEHGNDRTAVATTDEDSSFESFSIVPSAEYASFSVEVEAMAMPSMPSMPSYDEFASEQTQTTDPNNQTKEPS